MRPIRLCLMLAFVLAASPAWSYIVILKDGEQITATENWKREGDMVILELPNGTQVSYPAADIDFERTEEINRGRKLTNARLLVDGETRQLDENSRFEEGKKSFAELVNENSGGGLALPEKTTRQSSPDAASEPELPRTSAGFVDFMGLRRDPYENESIAEEVIRYLRGQGTQDARIFRGTSPGRPLLEVVAASEASVFKALRDSANCLVQARGQFPDLEAFDLLLLTGNQVRAGQFSLTPELANELVTGRVEPPSFFLRYVEF